MNHTHRRRILTHAGRVLLGVALAAPPVEAAVSFTDLGSLGMTGVEQGDLAWGHCDAGGELGVICNG